MCYFVTISGLYTADTDGIMPTGHVMHQPV